MEFFSPAFWTFAGLVFAALSSAVGYVVKRAWDARTEAKAAVEEEAEQANERLIKALEESAVLKTKIVYVEA